MEKLKRLIWGQGEILSGNILKVDSIINHQISPADMLEFGQEFTNRFEGIKVDRILTAEVSGISIALMTGLAMEVKYLTFARKKQPVTMTGVIYTQNAPSPTTGGFISLNVSSLFLRQGERVLIVDDFLASGYTLLALLRIIVNAGAIPVGIGVLIEKRFQNGREAIHEEFPDIKIESLATITEMSNTKIEFA